MKKLNQTQAALKLVKLCHKMKSKQNQKQKPREKQEITVEKQIEHVADQEP